MVKWIGGALKSRVAAGVILGLLLGFSGGYVFKSSQTSTLLASFQNGFRPIQQNDSPYAFVKPLLGYRTPEATNFGSYTTLKTRLQQFINSEMQNGNADRVSVYFRNLNTAEWIGINQNETYYPASLLKVPIMIAYYKLAESNSSILQKEIFYKGGTFASPFEATSTLVAGVSYTTEELIDHMIADSDNGATFALLSNIDSRVLSDVYADLGIQNPGTDSADYQISTRTYGLFFRFLYNTTYLSPEYSEKALKLLSKSTFKNGIVAGTPSGTLIAHKWGEHVVSLDGKTASGVELHDCGVVYTQPNPYLLCIMTSAKNLDGATNILKTIASIAYEEVEK